MLETVRVLIYNMMASYKHMVVTAYDVDDDDVK